MDEGIHANRPKDTDYLDRRDAPLFDLHLVKVEHLVGECIWCLTIFLTFLGTNSKAWRSLGVHLFTCIPYWDGFKHIGPMPPWLLLS